MSPIPPISNARYDKAPEELTHDELVCVAKFSKLILDILRITDFPLKQLLRRFSEEPEFKKIINEYMKVAEKMNTIAERTSLESN